MKNNKDHICQQIGIKMKQNIKIEISCQSKYRGKKTQKLGGGQREIVGRTWQEGKK